ncbi:MAG: hypothetical protein V4721_06635 [Bacteroidota bacterium]
MLTIILLLLLGLLIWRIIKVWNNAVVAPTHWHHHFANLNYSTQEFYAAIEQSVREKGIPDVHTGRKSYSEGGLFSANREYLRVIRKKKVFVICAAPFGKGFFVSWWHYEQLSIGLTIISLLPYIGPAWANSLQSKTFFQLDTEQMYKDEVHHSVLEVTDAMTAAKGVRQLNFEERRIIGEK